MRRLLVWFLLHVVVRVILLEHWGGWAAHGQVLQTRALSTPLKR